ncbi:fluoride efflux transporter CrcB [Rhodohalobacter mucosus]|uniref:Fluoride-specific ion channel n=2 Tax=Rhodohalobacter mucosus TaxID=2079485 RepID=A0A316TMA5_9BACT|nr:fluoride efflux transporter CrcB [Rhodohalobacter mucosus]
MIGSLLRYGVDILPLLFLVLPDPILTTALVNMTGCLFMGIAVVRLQINKEAADRARLFLLTGILGSFTTFSGYTIQSLELFKQSSVLFLLYFFGQVILGVLLLFAGAKVSGQRTRGQKP